MRQKLSTMGVFLLVLAVAAAGLGGCARSAREREAPDATPVATDVDSGIPSGEGLTPAPGETVVSAVTPIAETPGAEVQPSPVPVDTATAVLPLPTTVPEATTAPSPTQSQPSGTQGGPTTHIVQRGETLNSIARRYGTTWQALADANGLVNPNQIYVGQKLKIPTSGGAPSGTQGCRVRHTVKQGEWVWQIARNYGVSPYDILAANGLTIQQANTIYPGKVLCIP